MRKRVLVTGGAGFIGSHLVPELLKRGYAVVALDNLCSGNMENLGGVLDSPDFTFILGDIRDSEVLKKAFRGVSGVVHLAALIDVVASVTDPTSTNDVNVAGTLNVLQEAANCKVDRFVFASSTAVYGDAKALPITEETMLDPLSPYAASKAAGEAYCRAFMHSYGLSTVILRFFNVYGPRNEKSPYSGVITKFLRQAIKGATLNIFGDGEQTRDFIHVSDIVEALILALETQKASGETFNVCTGIQTSINDLAEAICNVTGRTLKLIHVPARAGEIRFSLGDLSKAEEQLHFKPKVTLQKGLELLLKAEKSE
ncbi:MAG: SDR family NAD(P)-dependent oxidoreductase [Candidatus Bathyarchaeota archaeon]|nr:SDR family NAD(P)-dependent oxidoreductase [Candidatus Bathyarchaeota archaeon]